MSDLELNNIVYKSRKHILEMIEDRGFSTRDITRYSKDELITLLENHKKGGFDTAGELSALDIIVNNPDTERKLVIKYRLDDKFKKSKKLLTQIETIYDTYELTKEDCLVILNRDIILYKDDMRSVNNVFIKFINELYYEGKFVQLYGLQNFLFNISKHIYVPKHRILTKSEIAPLTEKYFTDITKMPTIYREDPMAKYIGAHTGDLIEIKGYSETAGFISKYRLCIE